jgi:hypothetical protein
MLKLIKLFSVGVALTVGWSSVSASLEVVTLGEVGEVVNNYSVQCIK